MKLNEKLKKNIKNTNVESDKSLPRLKLIIY